MSNAIITENANTGTNAWIYSNFARLPVQVYCDKPSYNPGDTINFFVSTQNNGTHYTFAVYRLGYYQGLGGCLKSTSGTLIGVAQGYYDSGGGGLVSCPTAIINNTTHNIEAGWAQQTSYAIPGNAVTGVYVAIFTDANNFQSGCSFIVKSASSADYVAIRPTMTDVAYNDWGAHDLYTNVTVDVQSSYNKPMCDFGRGMGSLFNYEMPLLMWLEQQGYSINYVADIDVHNTPSLLLSYKAFISMGHDEYWTKARRDGHETAIAAGVSGAFMGANASYWQARLDTDNANNANRTVTCYKVTTGAANLANDPQYGVSNAIVTSQWRDAVLNRPEAAMIGIQYSSFNSSGNTAWKTDASMDTTYNAGTGLAANTSYGSDLTGYEWDTTASSSPSNLKTIGTSTPPGGTGTASTTFYKASSGALVFASGSVGWSWCLGTYRQQNASGYTGGTTGFVGPAVVSGMQVLLANIMGALKGPVFSMVSM